MSVMYDYNGYKGLLTKIRDSKAERLGIIEKTPCTWQGIDVSQNTYYCEKFNMGFGVYDCCYYRPYILLFNHRNIDDATKIAAISFTTPRYIFRQDHFFRRNRWKLTSEEVNNFAELMAEDCFAVEGGCRETNTYGLLIYMANSLLMHHVASQGMLCWSNDSKIGLLADSANYIKYITPYREIKMPNYRRLYAYKKS